MTKRLFFILGVIAGVLFAEVARRKKMERLKTLEAEKAEEKARYAEYAREWQAELATMPFEKRMDWELFQTSLKLSNYQPDWDEDEDDDDFGRRAGRGNRGGMQPSDSFGQVASEERARGSSPYEDDEDEDFGFSRSRRGSDWRIRIRDRRR